MPETDEFCLGAIYIPSMFWCPECEEYVEAVKPNLKGDPAKHRCKKCGMEVVV